MKEYQVRENLVEKYQELGSLSKVAMYYGVSKKLILNYMNKFGVPRKEAKINIDMDLALSLFNEGKNAIEISKVFNVSTPTIVDRFKEMGINTDRFHKGYSIKGSGYTLIYKKEHPYSDLKGYVPLHRLIVEEHIGRYLTKGEVVHHKDKDKTNNNIYNLEILTGSQHAMIHSKEERKHIDVEKAKQMLLDGMLQRDVAKHFNISIVTLMKKVNSQKDK